MNSRKNQKNMVRSTCIRYSGIRNKAMVMGIISAQRRPTLSDTAPQKLDAMNVRMLAQKTGLATSAGVQPSSFWGLPRDWGSGCGGHWRGRVIGGVETLPEAGAERAVVDGAADLEQPVGATP